VRGAPDAIVFQTYADLEGYLWCFSRTDHASVGIATRLNSVPSQYLWLRVDRFLAETCPDAQKEKRWAGLLPMAQDVSLWDTPCAGPGWALIGDAAGHVHPVTGEGIAYAFWSAELLATALGQRDPQSYDRLWQQECGSRLMAASVMLSRVSKIDGVYEMTFHLAMITAFVSSE
jgi:flavin-dependent dehydrogenase